LEPIRYRGWLVTPSPENKPRVLVVEVTSRCNLNCIHCFRNTMWDEEHGDMEIGVYRRVLREAREAGVGRIVFTGWGEPLVHPDIEDMLAEAKTMGFEVALNTNATLLRDHARSVARYTDEVIVSLDSLRPLVYREIRVGGSLAAALEGIEELNRYRFRGERGRPKLVIHYTLSRLNVDELPELPENAIRLGAVKVVVSNIIPLTREAEEKLALYERPGAEETVERSAVRMTGPAFTSSLGVSLPRMRLTAERSCPYMNASALFIRWDGLVAPCMHYSHNWRFTFMGVTRTVHRVVFGDASTQRLLDIWRGREYTRFRFRATFFAMPSCLDCPLAEYCSYNLDNTSDCWGNTPTCAHCPFSHDIVRCPL